MKHINSIAVNGMKKSGKIGNQSCKNRDEKVNTVKKPLL